MKEEKVLTDDDFYAKYHPEHNRIMVKKLAAGDYNERTTIADMCAHSGHMYETSGEEYARVEEMLKENPKRIWTVICVGEWEGICAGWHFVDRQGYIITEEEWTDGGETYVTWDTTELHEQWEGLPRDVVAGILDIEIDADMDEDEYDDLLTDNFYTWEEMDELKRDAYVKKYPMPPMA